jgi:hypothetical protein
MRYRPFGRTGWRVSVVGFGCWPMTGDRYGAIEDHEAVKAIFRGDNFRANVAVAERLRREVADPRGVPLSQNRPGLGARPPGRQHGAGGSPHAGRGGPWGEEIPAVRHA